MLDSAQAFLDGLGKPKPEKPPIIPKRWRMPFFVALAILSLLVLAAFARFVIVPAVRTQAPVSAPSSAPKP